MAYSFKRSDDTATDGLRRIALDQLDRAIASLDAAARDEGRHEAVHDARKRCKKLRGLVRLVRPGFDDYSRENEALRDAARLLSDFRDHTARIATYDALTYRYADAIDRDAFAPLREGLVDARRKADADPEITTTITAMREALGAVRDRAETWRVEPRGWDAFEPGLARTWKRARKAMERASRTRKAADLHQWRKRVKYHGYHARLLKRLWRPAMDPHVEAAGQLADLLGTRHDLAELGPVLGSGDMADDTRRVLDGLIEVENRRLEQAAFPLGRRLLADPPDALVHRWGTWHALWGD